MTHSRSLCRTASMRGPTRRRPSSSSTRRSRRRQHDDVVIISSCLRLLMKSCVHADVGRGIARGVRAAQTLALARPRSAVHPRHDARPGDHLCILAPGAARKPSTHPLSRIERRAPARPPPSSASSTCALPLSLLVPCVAAPPRSGCLARTRRLPSAGRALRAASSLLRVPPTAHQPA